MAERNKNVYAFACIKYEGRKCTGRKETAILAARSGKNNFPDIKFFMIKYKGILDWQRSTVTQPWNRLGALLKVLSKIMYLWVQLNPIIHLSVPFGMGGEKVVKLIPPLVLQCCCTKNTRFVLENVKPGCCGSKTRAAQTCWDLESITCLTLPLQHFQVHREEVDTLTWGEWGRTPSLSTRKCGIASWHCCQSFTEINNPVSQNALHWKGP